MCAKAEPKTAIFLSAPRLDAIFFSCTSVTTHWGVSLFPTSPIGSQNTPFTFTEQSMAVSTCLARHIALRGPRAVKTIRTLSQRTTPFHAPIARVLAQKCSSYKSRHFSCVPPRHNVAQEAPNPEAYLNSGAIKGARDLVDVKKVLVIGSGGLSIGQAGEFDYSGMSFCSSVVRSLALHKYDSPPLCRAAEFSNSTMQARRPSRHCERLESLRC